MRVPRLLRAGVLPAVIWVAACGGSDEPDARRCRARAADDVTAQTMARTCGTRVEVASQRTEYSALFVDPSGSRTLVAAVVPQHARRRDGTWGAIDTTLHEVDGAIAPAGTAADVRFSTGGDGPFVTLTRDGHQLALSWPAPLPAPTLSGASATYASVLPDVDLVVTATETGFTHQLVVKSARAATNPAVRRASYRIGGDARVISTPEGGLVAEADGVRIASAEPAVMWDTAAAAEPPVRGDVAAASLQQARVDSAVADQQLILTPAAAMLDDPAARFPLVIDPLWVVGQNQWAYASADNQNGPTTDSHIGPGDPSPAAAALRVGNDPDCA